MPTSPLPTPHASGRPSANLPVTEVLRLKSREVMQQMREIEIDHEGKIYRLRITQLNKLILTG